MHVRSWFPGLLLASVAAGCADIPSKINPLNNGLTVKPYDGIAFNSYGALTKTELPYCDPNGRDPLYAALKDVGKDITGLLYMPIGGATVYDDVLIKEELQDQFRTIGNPGEATVVVLKRDNKAIYFWYSMDEVSTTEVSNAARKYCS